MTTDNNTSWEAFYRANQTRAASPLLRRALGDECLAKGNGHAIDLGCGGGIETALLLTSGWKVLAIDKAPNAIARIETLKAKLPGADLKVMVSRFEELKGLPSSALTHAGLSLPFCEPTHFPMLWDMILSALEPGGLFVGHLFGNRHDWARHPTMSFHTTQEVEALCNGLEAELFRESEGEGGLVKHHWHRFDFILKKPRI